MSLLRQTIRGCGTLPYVGEHPGTVVVIALVGAGGLAGAAKAASILGALVGGVSIAAVIVPIYLAGAYSRAELSDRLAEKRAALRSPAVVEGK